MKRLKNTKRKLRNRKKLRSVSQDRHRLTVFRSLKNIFAQIVDDKNEKEIKKEKNKKMNISEKIGEILAKRAKEKKIENVYFDRGAYKYHGRVKALAESLRKNGLKF